MLEANHSPTYNAEIKSAWNYATILPYDALMFNSVLYSRSQIQIANSSDTNFMVQTRPVYGPSMQIYRLNLLNKCHYPQNFPFLTVFSQRF